MTSIDVDGKRRNGRILKLMGHHGLHRVEVEEAQAGDIVCISGFEPLFISDTLCDQQHVEALPPLSVDEPTVSMTFQSTILRLPVKKVNLLPAVILKSDWKKNYCTTWHCV